MIITKEENISATDSVRVLNMERSRAGSFGGSGRGTEEKHYASITI
jgi:hypothetical protein